jgi:hypothetical protein
MRWLKNPMANAVYVALITAIYAAIFIVSSEFVMSYENLLSDSGFVYHIPKYEICGNRHDWCCHYC